MRAWGNWLDPIDLKSIALCIPVRVRVPAPKNDCAYSSTGQSKGLINLGFPVRVGVGAPS